MTMGRCSAGCFPAVGAAVAALPALWQLCGALLHAGDDGRSLAGLPASGELADAVAAPIAGPVLPRSMMRWWSFTGDVGGVHAEVKQTKGRPGPGHEDFAVWKPRAVPEG